MSLGLAAVLAISTAIGGPLPAEVQEVIDRSHTSRANYSVVLQVQVTRNGVTSMEQNAEYQIGAMHRVDTLLARVLANCETGQNLIFDVVKSRLVLRPESGRGACGIAVGTDIVVGGRMLPPIKGTFGKADVIELIGEKFVRRYAVTPDGIIVANDYLPRHSDVAFSLKTLSTKLVRGKPDRRLFKTASLTKPAPRLR